LFALMDDRPMLFSDDRILFRVDRAGLRQCALDELAPAVRARLTERIVLQGHSNLALHTASLARDRQGLLLCGQPGMGKSILTLHLTDDGFQYGGDDVVLIQPDGEAEADAGASQVVRADLCGRSSGSRHSVGSLKWQVIV
jgi:hypothetical protein